tara:strand:- start:1710 stop:3530 length:1821 start_codon:yes stop_codon:yes gene_type:complete
MLSTHQLPQPKPWDPVIDRIDQSLVEMKAGFEKAFAEGYNLPTIDKQPKEWIKLKLIKFIFEHLEANNDRYDSLSELDDYFHQFNNVLPAHIQDFLQSRMVAQVCKKHHITVAASDNKLRLISTIVSLYHALKRTRFMLQKLNLSYSLDQCQDEVFSLRKIADVNTSHYGIIDYTLYKEKIVEPLKSLNQTFTLIMKEKGYGDVVIENVLLPYGANSARDSMFLPLYAQLRSLPSMSTLVAEVTGSQPGEIKINAVNLMAQADTIHAARLVLRHATNKIIADSVQQVDGFEEQCQALKDIQDQTEVVRQAKLNTFFRKLAVLHIALVNETQKTVPYPVLREAAEAASYECNQQSSNFLKKCWSDIRDNLIINMKGVLAESDKLMGLFDVQYHEYHDARELMHAKRNPLEPSFELIAEWRQVNQQTVDVLDKCDDLMSHIEKRVRGLSETHLQHLKNYLKRHWPELTVGVAASTGVSTALTLTVFAANTLAPFITLPAVALGLVGGVVAGKVRDKLSPPTVPLRLDRANASVLDRKVDTGYISTRLFGTQEQPVIIKEVEMTSMSESHADASSASMSWLSRFNLFGGGEAGLNQTKGKAADLKTYKI